MSKKSEFIEKAVEKMFNSIIYGNSNTVAAPSLTMNAIDNTSGYSYIRNPLEDYQYKDESNGVLVEDLSNIEGLYKAIYTSLLKNNPDKSDNWQLLLKLNDNSYRLTVLQIEVEKGV